MADPLYLIGEGLRRTVAVREAGATGIDACVEVQGVRGPVFRVRLDQLYSRKDRVSRSDPQGRYLSIERATAAGVALPPIQVEPLSPVRARHFTRVANVVLDR